MVSRRVLSTKNIVLFFIILLVSVTVTLYFCFGFEEGVSDIDGMTYKKWFDGAKEMLNEITFEIKECNCSRRIRTNITKIESFCNDITNTRGLGQRVLSYSLFGNAEKSLYYSGLLRNIELVPMYYPSFIIRIYTDWKINRAICDSVVCKFPNVDWCDVSRLRPSKDWPFGKLGTVDPRTWRFLVFGDPSVDIGLIRDTDSLVSDREKSAVYEWVRSNTQFHVMRDNPEHTTEILAGMWGFRRGVGIYDAILKRRLWDSIKAATKVSASFDQKILREIVWPYAVKNMTSHDSYLCTQYPNTSPWPTKRSNLSDFVGNVIIRFPNSAIHQIYKCPVKCRPPKHRDWEYC